MGMSGWECELRPCERRTNIRAGEFWHIPSNAPAGTFQVTGNKAVVSYGVDLIQDPRALIAVFAHELCHYLQETVPEPSPGGFRAHELMAELAVAYCGFGVFAANAAFHFEQHRDAFSQGWSTKRQGYLSERTWAFAIALFLTLKGHPGAARDALKPNIAQTVKQAERYLERNPQLWAPLRAIV